MKSSLIKLTFLALLAICTTKLVQQGQTGNLHTTYQI